MSWSLYISLSLMMFLEYSVWGAWYPVLATRLLGPLKMNGKQTGWIYATLPLACIFMPLVAGQVADRWLNTEWMLAVPTSLARCCCWPRQDRKSSAPCSSSCCSIRFAMRPRCRWSTR